MPTRDWRFFIADILGSVKLIQEYAAGMSFEEFQNDRKTADAVIRNFIIIGEAARNIPDEIKRRYPKLPWRFMNDMRNFSVHVLGRRAQHCLEHDPPRFADHHYAA